MFQGRSDGVTGGKFQATAKATTRSSPLLSLSLRSATGDRAPPPFSLKVAHARVQIWAGPSGPSADWQASKTKDSLTRSSPVVRYSAYQRSIGSGNGIE